MVVSDVALHGSAAFRRQCINDMGHQLRSALSMLLDVPENEWARRFVLQFPHRHDESLSGLLNPESLRKAVCISFLECCSMTESSVVSYERAPQASSNQVVRETGSCDVLLVPAWMQNNITVGVSVYRLNLFSCPLKPPTQEPEAPWAWTTCGRFARCERTGEILIVGALAPAKIANPASSAPRVSSPLVQVLHCRHISNRDSLETGVMCSEDLFAAGKYEQAPISCQVALRRRASCPTCGQPTTLMCECPIRLHTPKYALDFSAFGANSNLQFDSFTGKTTFWTSLTTSGRSLRMSYDSVGATTDSTDELARALCSLAVSDVVSVSNTPPAPLSQYAGDSLCATDTRSPAEWSLVPSGQRARRPRLQFNTSRHPLRDASNAGCDGTRDDTSLETCHSAEPLEHIQESATASAVEACTRMRKLDEGACHSESTTLRSCVYGSAEHPNAPPQTVQTDIATKPNTVTYRERHPDLSQAQPHQDLEKSGSATVESSSMLGISEDRLAMLLDRRRRNRESAARSNAKRKAYHRSLTDGVKQGRDKIRQLRERESALRQENEELRARLIRQQGK